MGLIGFLRERDKKKTLAKLQAQVDKINALEEKYAALSDEELAAQTDVLKERYKAGETLDQILFDAFAVVREASKRVLHMRHFDVQLDRKSTRLNSSH